MKITIAPFNPEWHHQFNILKQEIEQALHGQILAIDHIGSTSIEGLAAKPIIDILVAVADETAFDEIIPKMKTLGFVYYALYNEDMPYRRFFVKYQHPLNLTILDEQDITPDLQEQENRLAHVHIIPQNSIHWKRHIAFKNYLLAHPEIKVQYQALKKQLEQQDWESGNDYNKAKNSFIKTYEQKALKWYFKKNKAAKKVSADTPMETRNKDYYQQLIQDFRKNQDWNLLQQVEFKNNGETDWDKAKDLNFWNRKDLAFTLWEMHQKEDRPLLKWMIQQELKAQEIMMPYYVLDMTAFMLYKHMEIEDVFDLFLAKFEPGNIFYMDVELIFGLDRQQMKVYLSEVSQHPLTKEVLKAIIHYEDAIPDGAIYKDRADYIHYFETRKINFIQHDLMHDWKEHLKQK